MNEKRPRKRGQFKGEETKRMSLMVNLYVGATVVISRPVTTV